MDAGVQYKPLSVFNEKKGPVSYKPNPLQIRVRTEELLPNSSAVLVDRMDINENGTITEPGKYFVQFDSTDLSVGKPIPHDFSDDRFGERLSIGVFNFLPATNKFPSNVVEIKVRR